MPQSLAQIYLHLVFSTKERHPFLRDRSLRDDVHHYLGNTCTALGCCSLGVGGIEDHVHLCCRLGRSITVAHLVRELKRESSKWIKTKAEALEAFYWQNGYGAFSV